jgi:hypothetical protein
MPYCVFQRTAEEQEAFVKERLHERRMIALALLVNRIQVSLPDRARLEGHDEDRHVPTVLGYLGQFRICDGGIQLSCSPVLQLSRAHPTSSSPPWENRWDVSGLP